MTIEMHASIAESERGGRIVELETGSAPVDGAFADLFSRLGAMRRMLGATTFAVFAGQATSAIGSPLTLTLQHGLVAPDNLASLATPAGKIVADHAERSTVPIAWGPRGSAPARRRRARIACAGAVVPGAVCEGVAFPVRLGAVGNGIVVFEGGDLNLESGTVFNVHRMAFRLMGDLLRIEMARNAPRQSLSERELECLQWAGGGFKSEAIADKLGLSVHTVNAYLSTATAKLDSVNRIQAIAKAIRLGFIA